MGEDYKGKGRESEWNEASFKSLRLHQVQEIINYLKMNPSNMNGREFSYLSLLKGIDVLYGEGYSKYSKTERDDVDKIRKLSYDYIKIFPPHKIITVNLLNGNKKIFYLNQSRFDTIMEILELFVRKVKDLNDKHGLTTKNKKQAGMF